MQFQTFELVFLNVNAMPRLLPHFFYGCIKLLYGQLVQQNYWQLGADTETIQNFQSKPIHPIRYIPILDSVVHLESERLYSDSLKLADNNKTAEPVLFENSRCSLRFCTYLCSFLYFLQI